MRLDELLIAARSEDPEVRVGSASREFWTAVILELQRYLRKHERPDADDIIQATLAVICAKLDSYQPTGPDSFVRWIRVIATLKSREWKRKQMPDRLRFARLPTPLQPAPPTSPTCWVLRRERAQLADTQLAKLSAEQRRAIAHGLDGAEDHSLAERERVPVATVWTRRHSGIAKVSAGIAAQRRTPADS